LAYAKLSGYHSMAFLSGFDRSEERLALARQAVDRALELEPNLAEAQRALGLYYYRGYRDYDRSLEAFSVAAQHLPNDAALLQDVAYIRRRRGAFAMAAADFEKAVALNPRSSTAAWQLGATLIMMRRYAEAAPHMEAAISLGPDDFEPYVLAAWTYLAWDSTAARARAALEQMPTGIDPVGDAVVAWYEVNSREGRDSEILERLSQFPGAVFRQQFWLIPKAALYAMVYRRMEDLPRATAYFDTARTLLEQELEESPEDPRVHASLGLVYAGLGRKDDAVRAAERAAQLEPVSRDAMLGPAHVVTLAEVLVTIGEHSLALEHLERLLSIPAGFWISTAMLRADPRWNPLRGNRRFQALLERYED
jgi:serine/threonine-protein kinase